MKKPGRNDPCSCGSGKKYKKCCEAKEASSRFTATKLDAESAPQIKKALGLTSLFQSSTVAIPKKPLAEEASEKQDLEGKGRDLLDS